MDNVWAVVVAGGSGSRFGGAKQYETIDGRAVIEWSLTAAADACDGVVAVVPPRDVVHRPLMMSRPPDVVVGGGRTRSASVRNGLAAVPDDASIVVVHDAARPLAAAPLWAASIDAVRCGADAALCAVPLTDTVKRVSEVAPSRCEGPLEPGGVRSEGPLGPWVVETIDRSALVAVQTPQAFRAAVLRAAHLGGPEATDDGALVEALGGRVVIVPGSPVNIKITHPHDLVLAAALAGLAR